MDPKRASKNGEAQARRGNGRHGKPSRGIEGALNGWERARSHLSLGAAVATAYGVAFAGTSGADGSSSSGTTGGSTDFVEHPTISGENPLTGVITGSLNAEDPDGDRVTYTVTGVPSHGALTMNPDGPPPTPQMSPRPKPVDRTDSPSHSATRRVIPRMSTGCWMCSACTHPARPGCDLP